VEKPGACMVERGGNLGVIIPYLDRDYTFPFKANLCTHLGAVDSSPFKGEVGRGMGVIRHD